MSMDSSKRRRLGIAVVLAFGGAGIGLLVVALPFILPALRRYCLPYVPATPVQIERVLSQLEGRKGKVVDLGSGDGRVVIAAAKQGHYAVGYELNPWLVLYSRWKAFMTGVHKSTAFYRRDLWKVDLSKYENIVIFGVDQMMEPLGEKIAETVSPTTRVIACRFQFPHWAPTAKFEMGANSVWVYDNVKR